MSIESSSFAKHVKGEVTALALCCKLRLRDGAELMFTNSTEDLYIDHTLYRATTLIGLSSIETTNNFSVDNLDVIGMLNSIDVKEHDVLSGRYDLAEIEVFTINCGDLSEKVIQRKGFLGEVTVQDGKFTAEIRGLTQNLQCNVGELYSSSCRAVFSDARCKVPIQDYTHTGVVEGVDPATNRQNFIAKDIAKPNGYFVLGEIIWLTGKNIGLRMEIKEYSNSQFILKMAMSYVISKDDTFSVIAGCDKTFTTCCNKFKNATNYRGEPHVPGRDKILETPGA
jgi:uncharacterized phage protein (TIGR02218 family)